MSIYFILGGVSGPFVGKWTQTQGPKKVMTVSALGFGTCFILLGFTQALWYFYAIYALLAVLHSGMAFIPVSTVLAGWFVRKRGTAIGFAMLGIATGGLVLAPVVGFITAHFGWRMSFVFLGILVWVLGLPVTLFVVKGSPLEMGLLPDGDLPDSPETLKDALEGEGPSQGPGQEGWPLTAALRTRAFWWIAATYLLAPLAQMGVLQHQVPLIMEAGISQAAAATALGLTSGIGGLGKLAFGRISEMVSIQYAALLCFGLQALGVLMLLHVDSLTWVWIYVITFGFAMGGVIVLLPLLVGHFFGLSSFGVILGTLSMTQALGGSLGSVLSGLVYDWMGSYDVALTAYIGMYLTSILTIFLTGKARIYRKAI
jgi:sugar phosphate permease